ncbi:MAG TPA: hypothetical protein VNL74_08730 [Methylococcus sp.]|nr:hypothetical protein [Methylococcus sp.]
MSKKFQKTPLSAVMQTAIVTSLSTGMVHAAENNPFAVKELASGYQQVAEAGKGQTELKCGVEVMKAHPEMKCGASMMQGMESNAPPTNERMKKDMEGKCAGMKTEESAPAAPAEQKTQ